MSRDAFLTRVRQAAEMGRAYRVHLQDVPEDVGYVGVDGDLVQRFAAEVDEVGGQRDHAALEKQGNIQCPQAAIFARTVFARTAVAPQEDE